MSHDRSTIPAALKAIAGGDIIIVMDAEDRENEGDFICAAETVTAATVNFMITHGRGLVCMALPASECRRLELPSMVDNNTSAFCTAFTVSVDHGTCKTGITAQERAAAIRALADPASEPSDFVRPGHVFPLVAAEGGVLNRPGHTECAVDLPRMAGLRSAGVLCEILDEDGDRADREQLMKFARQYRLEIVAVEDIVSHRKMMANR